MYPFINNFWDTPLILAAYSAGTLPKKVCNKHLQFVLIINQKMQKRYEPYVKKSQKAAK